MKDSPDFPTPTAVDSEKALLGAVLLNEAAFWDVADFLLPDHFFLIAHRRVWESFVALKEQRRPLDLVTVSEELERRGELATVGGVTAISELMDGVPSAIHAEAYGRAVEATALRRALLMAASTVAQEAYNEGQSVEVAIEKAERALLTVGDQRITRDIYQNRELATPYHDQVMARREQDITALGPRTGFADLDRLLGGLGIDNLVVLAGRPGMGKTSLALQIGYNVAQQEGMHGEILMFSLEMSRWRLFNRLVSLESGIPGHALERGVVSAPLLGTFGRAVGVVGDLRMTLCDPPGISPLGVRTRCRRVAGERGLALVVVDYLQLMHIPGVTDEYAEVSAVSRQMKELARELSVPVLLLSQLNRQVEARSNKRPMISDLRGSGSIEQDADIVLMLYRDEYYNEHTLKPNVAEVEVAKNRDGPTGRVELYWNAETTSFRNLEARVVS